tara:strand:- start:117 stop:893 length:777 start_codon:yes stop_codon:yes gene_type:complete
MPSKSKKQLELFRLVKAYVDGGPDGFVIAWRNMYPTREFPDVNTIEKVVKISETINYGDLEDMASGLEGVDVKVGNWMLFDAYYRKPSGDKGKGTFIAKINKVVPNIKLVNFNSEDIYSKSGGKIAPLKRTKITSTNNMWLNFAYFDQIKETAKNKNDLIMLKEIRNIVRNCINEVMNESLEIQKRGSDEMVSVSTGMLVQKKSELVKEKGNESRGKIINVGIDDSIPAKNNINIRWTHGDLSGTEQTVYPEDILAIK